MNVLSLVFLGLALQAGPCGPLASFPVNGTITAVTFVEAGPDVSQGRGGPQTGRDLPAHCRIAATLSPVDDSAIGMELWLPVEGWNGKFLAVGNGAWAGTISFSALADGLREGYAVASTDTGHTGGSAVFALGHPEKVIDFGYRSIHEMAVQSKAMIESFYDEAPRYSYYNGCSTGGRQGLAEAQRFPGDFDALVIGAPVYNQTHLHAAQVQKFVEILNDEERYLPPEKVRLVADAVMAACDGNDGVVDGLIEDPRMCRFDPATLACPGADADGICLSQGQLASVERAYSAVRTSDGRLVYPGHAFGFELGWRMPEPGSTPPDLPIDTFRYLAHEDPEWDWQTFELDRDLALALENAPAIESSDPDLRAFRDRGGKIIMYHGWNDPGPSPMNTILYHDAVEDLMGPDQNDWLRMYLMPGVGHCRGGVGPDQAHFMGALERWVEAGEAPDRIVASKVVSGTVRMTRPLCPHPQVAEWSGIGSTNDATNFVCTAP